MSGTDHIRNQIEMRLHAAGWIIQNREEVDLRQSLGVVIRDFPLARGYGAIDYLLHLEGRAVGLVELRSENTPLTGVPVLAEKHARGLPFSLRLFMRPLPFLYQSTGREVCFTNAFDPAPAPRGLRGFHRPETLKKWIEDGMVGETPRDMAAEDFPEHRRRGRTFHERMLINLPPLAAADLSPGQMRVMTRLEQSFKENRRRVLVDMRAGAERTAAAIRFAARIVQFANARRVLFLVHSAATGQALARKIEDAAFSNDNSPFTQAAAVQHLTGTQIDPDARLCIATLPHLHNLLKNQDLPEPDEASAAPLPYNMDFPIETFDVVMIDHCESLLTGAFRPVLEYFDACLVGLASKPEQQALDFFDRNRVTDDSGSQEHPDGLNVI